MAKCKGKAMWSYLNKVDTKYTPCWRIQLMIDRGEAMKLIELGLKKQVKKIDELMFPDKAALGEYEVKFVRYEQKRGKFKGQDNTKPTVVNADNEPFEEILGNGSDVIVKFSVYQWKNNFGTGIGADLEGVKVINHIPYVAAVVDNEDEAENTVPAVKKEEPADEDDKW